MKQLLFLLLACFVLAVEAQAVELPDELYDAAPRQAREAVGSSDLASPPEAFQSGLKGLALSGKKLFGDVLKERLRGAVQVLMVVVICGAAEGLGDGKAAAFAPMAGALAIGGITVGRMDTLLGLGKTTIHELAEFSRILLPSLAAASAAAGGITGSTAKQMITLFAIQIFVSLMEQLMLPLTMLYAALLTAGGCLGDGRLDVLADSIKKLVTWILCGGLLLFTGYLSAVHVLAGSVDGTALKLTKAVISGMVPVVGGIISETTASVLAGAEILKGTIGVFGILAVLSVCLVPFIHLGTQYLLYKIVAVCSGVFGSKQIAKLISGLGGAFGLILGMAGSCALLILIAVLSFTAGMVT